MAMTVVLVWVALSAVAALVFAFGSSLGYRRGFEDARTVRTDAPRDVRLPRDVHSAT